MASKTQSDRDRFWQGVEETARRVANWPDWKQHPKPADIVARSMKGRPVDQPPGSAGSGRPR